MVLPTIVHSIILYLLFGNKEKIHEEVREIFGDSDRFCTTEDIMEMKYLECAIKETLRLYPSVPAILRNLSEDAQIGIIIS